ncbi:hypothetical protein FVE85_1599 [Porphyridium purpureum]|uniref:Uncharacterized protein n=1 Tax=Porphyridium purpureum TaxID=35688 RepID=A0A5J4YXN8_PORPP|nr:hypothetical protein FVE85_1599 [Porphyridium purpureum]|eukprot:POR4326..scf209_3
MNRHFALSFTVVIVSMQLLWRSAAENVTALGNPEGGIGRRSSDLPAYQKYGGGSGRNGKYLVLSVNYGDWFTNSSIGACEASRSLCTDPLNCQLTREVTLDELRTECPQVIPGGLSARKQNVIVQTGTYTSGSTWQLRSIHYLLSHLGLNPYTIHSPKPADLVRLKLSVESVNRPTLIKTHEYYRRDFRDVGDTFFTSFILKHRSNQICLKTHPNAFPDKSCKCCFAAYHTKNVYAVRLAELMGAASSLGLDIESIDFDAVLDSVHAWYQSKYKKNVQWI